MAKAPAVTKQRATALATTSFSDDLADLKSRLAAPGGDKIKAENKQFKLPSGATANELDIVIVDFIHFNAFYETGYTKGVVSAPGCAALGIEPKGMVPLPAGTAIQNAGCDGCAQNQFGSKGAGKACQNRILVAVLPADADETTPMALFDLPPTSIQQFVFDANLPPGWTYLSTPASTYTYSPAPPPAAGSSAAGAQPMLG